jgi:phage shock protein PspC (stress-responsive transcriptional regulator)
MFNSILDFLVGMLVGYIILPLIMPKLRGGR